jgi:hypothetical protein
MDSSMNINDVGGVDDIPSIASNPNPIDNSFSIRQIMQQQSVMNLDNEADNVNTNPRAKQVSQRPEQSSRHFAAILMPRQASAYVFSGMYFTKSLRLIVLSHLIEI